MPETTSNIEFAHRIHEQGLGHGSSSRQEWLEILEAVVLAAVAVLTAWSGYQAARWDAKSAASYSRAALTSGQAAEQDTLAGQDHLYDITTFGGWMNAQLRGDDVVRELFERRFRPEYITAFRAWIKMDPLHNESAPASPTLMPEYHNTRADRARELRNDASKLFQQGVSSRETGDEYIRITVVLATVLLLTALSQRFRIRAARVGLLCVAIVMLAVAVFWIAAFPRA